MNEILFCAQMIRLRELVRELKTQPEAIAPIDLRVLPFHEMLLTMN